MSIKTDNEMVIENHTLSGYNGVESQLVIPIGTTSVASCALMENSAIKSVILPPGLSFIGDAAFCNCFNLENLFLPAGLMHIGDDAFFGCKNLKEVAFPKTLDQIGALAFAHCESLEVLHIPRCVSDIKPGAFAFCNALQHISVEENSEMYCTINNQLYTITENQLIAVPGNTERVELSPSTKVIGQYAYAGLRRLQEATIPGHVQRIEQAAFTQCTQLRVVDIQEGVSIIEDFAFSECTNLESVCMPQSVIHIGAHAFDNCSPKVIFDVSQNTIAAKYARDHGFRIKETSSTSSRKPATSDPTGYVFISYSSQNQQMADSVRLLFIEKGIHCWMAPYDIPAGSKYAFVINDALENCACLVLLLTNASQESQFVEREIERAITYKKPIIPMQLEDIRLNSGFKFYIGNSQIIAVPNINADAPEFNMVIAGVRQFLGQDNISLPEMKKTTAQSLSAPKNTDNPLESALPDQISLFELLKISNIGELDIERIWAESDVTKAIVAPIGVDQTGKSVSIDLHQRADGPNGMVIGPPGSGKTEFLHTYLLSLALHYPPEKIQLHLINSHDPSIVDDFVSLPHTGICLNEYTDSKVTDFVAYFKNEILCRQDLLKRYSVANIYQYHKLAKTDPTLPALPHIVVAVDELQQLKCYFPAEAEYLQELGTGEQARAYGIHLLYATGHAEGIIDDSLYRVLNFKICSSMQSHFSQKESPKHGRPGRLYLQTQSHDSIRVIQLAYSGLPAPIANANLSSNQWFFENKTQRQSIIQAITRLCLD